MKNAVGLAIVALLLCIAGVSAVRATDTEADAIDAVWQAWKTETSAETLDALDALYADASEACRAYISLLFNGIALFDAGLAHSPDNRLGTMVAVGLLAQYVEKAAYACRVAI